jgi:cytochrome c551/c552
MHKLVALCIGLALGLTPITRTQSAPIVVGFERLYEAQGKPTAQQGRVLLGELGCTACHDAPEGMTSNHKRGPSLENIGARMNTDYLYAWIKNPNHLKPGTTMPNNLAYDAGTSQDMGAIYLTSFLLSRSEAFVPDEKEADAELIERGNTLFHSIGCVACHTPFEPPNIPHNSTEDKTTSSISQIDVKIPSVRFPDLHAKSNHTSLTKFLLDPHTLRSSGRMPSMDINQEEAEAIAAYLRAPKYYSNKLAKVKIAETDSNFGKHSIQKGKELYNLFGCVACHEQEKWKMNVPPLIPEDKGCLTNKRANLAPVYNLEQRQIDAIKLALTATEASTPAEKLDNKLAALNCYACHERNGVGGIEPAREPYFHATGEFDLGDEGRIPPTLTGVGAKLTKQGFQDILINGHSVRPYMATRMPQFGEDQVADLAEAFLAVDKDPNPIPNSVSGLEHHHRSRYGRTLMGTEGLGCISCHNLHGTPSLGIPALDLATVPERLQPTWFKQYLYDPAALRPGTRMPKYFEDNKSPYTKLWKGDAGKQIEAIWIYLEQAHPGLLPVGMEQSEDYALIPTDAPILLRTFMENVGAQAIAVGNSQGIHYAFDARHARLALAWRGQYIDAHATWADRFNPFATPLSDDQHPLPDGMPIAAIKSPQDAWPIFIGEEAGYTYKGYRLSEASIPTFLYTLTAGDEVVNIEETITAKPNKTLLRTFIISGNIKTPLYTRRTKDGKAERLLISPSANPTKVQWTVSW